MLKVQKTALVCCVQFVSNSLFVSGLGGNPLFIHPNLRRDQELLELVTSQLPWTRYKGLWTTTVQLCYNRPSQHSTSEPKQHGAL
ncbi:hypothetical protein BDR04DRAFT_1087991 [Suillus decipiens]|nr:hypothetical protein BDR04DRAFT_1087991 [Suillus decipiens]